MNGIQAFTSEPWVTRLGWTLLHFLWQGTAIALLYAAVRFLFARTLSAHARCTLACAALLAMAVAPPLTFLIISGAVPASALVAAIVPMTTLTVTEWQWLAPIAVGLWVTGVFWFSMRLLGAVQFTHRLRTTAHAAPDIWQQTLEQIAARMGRPCTPGNRQVRLMGSSMVNVPAVIGCLRPVVLVPVAFLTGLPAEHVVALLSHELAHIRRNDYLIGMLQSLAEIALFYHPAVWWISGQIRIERELCCDDLVIAAGTDRLTYARALTEMECVRRHRLTPQMAANGGSLVDRIRTLIEPSYIGSHQLPGAGSAWAMILLLLVGAGVVPVHGAQKSAVSHPTQTVIPSTTNPQPSDSTLDSVLGQAQKTLLFDPVFSAQLAQPRPMPAQVSAPQATNPVSGLVFEPVAVKNASDITIDGLRRDDFAITEDGNPQQISFFEFENVDKLADAAPSPAPAVPRYKDHRLLALYFDMSSMPVPDQARALDAAQKFISTQMSQADMLSLIRYTGAGAEVLQDFTSDRNRLLSVIATMARRVADGPATTPAEKLAALRAAVMKLGSLSEKKSLVYFSSGLSLSPMENQAALRITINEAVRAGVSIWPAAATSNDALNTLAADTNGKATASAADLATAIVAAEKSIKSYYLVGYSSTNQTPDGKYRRVGIALNDSPGAKLDYRPGYFARKDFGTGVGANKERQLEDALLSGDPVTDLTLAAEVNYFRMNKAETFAPITVKIPGGPDQAELDLIAEIKDDQGTTIQTFRDHMENRLPDSPATWNTGAKLLPGTYSMKILARDSGTGKMGEFLGKFTIQNLDKETQMPISSVVLSSQFVDEPPSTALPGTAVPASNPLIHDGKRMIPSVTRVFSTKDDMYVYLQAFEKGAKTAAPLMAHVTFYKGASKILETPAVTVSDGLDPKSGMMPIRMNVGLTGLKPGEYDCQVTVLDPATQKSALWQKPVTIVP
jgi:VWFA-related protein